MKALRTARKPSAIEWIFSMAIVVVGILLAACNLLPGTTPENELTLIQGVPANVIETKTTSLRRGQTSVVQCTLSPYRFEWGSAEPHYDEVKSALAGGVPVEAWVSTKRERRVLNLDSTLVRLYKLRAGGRQILDYSESAAAGDNNSLLIVGSAIALLGVLSVYINWRQLQLFNSGGTR